MGSVLSYFLEELVWNLKYLFIKILDESSNLNIVEILCCTFSNYKSGLTDSSIQIICLIGGCLLMGRRVVYRSN